MISKNYYPTNMSVYVAFHENYPLLTEDRIYRPLHVGKALSKSDLGFIGDNTGDNISEKNRNYSELTGLYWIWKNTNSEIVGLCHYRRYFTNQKISIGMRLKRIYEWIAVMRNTRYGIHYLRGHKNAKLILKGSEISDILNAFDAILPFRRRFKITLLEHYRRKHHSKDLEITRQIIEENHADYKSAFQEVMKKKELLPGNMFVMKRMVFEDYMEWLFAILFELEKRIDISDYDNYQKRIFGFISERLLDVWITKQKLKYKQLPVLYFKHLKKQTVKNN